MEDNHGLFKNLKKIAALGMFLLGFFPATTFAFGVSPGHIELHNLKSENKAEERYTFSRADATRDEKVVIKFDDSIKPYIKSLQGYELKFLAGQNQLEYFFTVEPFGLKEGNYKGNAFIQLIPPGDLGGKNLSGLQARINFTVTNKDVELFKIDQLDVPTVKENNNLKTVFYLDNQGNVPAAATSLLVKLEDKIKGESLWTKTFDISKESLTAPFSRAKHEFDTGTALAAGSYKVSLDFLDRGGKLIIQKDFNVDVQGYPLPWKSILIVILGVIGVGAVGGMIFHILRMRRPKK